MELCEGGALLDRIQRRGPQGGRDGYSEAYIARITRSILRFVSQCHAKGIVYRDIKPDNFLFLTKDEDAALKATDFGLSIRHWPYEPKLDSRTGTPAYMAPELVLQVGMRDRGRGGQAGAAPTTAVCCCSCSTYSCNRSCQIIMSQYLPHICPASVQHLANTLHPPSLAVPPAAPVLLEQNYDEKCDIWSVGMLAYQLLTGRFPYWEDVRSVALPEV